MYCSLAYALKKVIGTEKLFYIVSDGRDDIDVSGSIGMFARIHPVWIKVDSEDPYEFTKRALDRIDASLEYSDVTLLSMWKLRNIWPDIVIQFNNFSGLGTGN